MAAFKLEERFERAGGAVERVALGALVNDNVACRVDRSSLTTGADRMQAANRCFDLLAQIVALLQLAGYLVENLDDVGFAADERDVLSRIGQ